MSLPDPGPREPPILAWYGDDFTGSASVLEVLAFAGLRAVLFLDPPGPTQLARFSGMQAIGVAGDARSRSNGWMRANLPPIFRTLRMLRPRILHYKVCSTLDSAPHVGSIGLAADLLLGENEWAPLVIAAPAIGRWQAFGTLFARFGDGVHRLDRHPGMCAHPVTPMDEADVRLHLGQQTARRTGLVDLLALKGGHARRQLGEQRAAGASLVAFDIVDDETLRETGGLILDAADAVEGPLPVIGSQGLEYALVSAWNAGRMALPSVTTSAAAPVRRIAAISGSCSPVTAEQIAHAQRSGYAIVRIDAALAVDQDAWSKECNRAAAAILSRLGEACSTIGVTALGPGDPAIAACAEARSAAGISPEDMNLRIGAGLGQVLDRVLEASRLPRVVIAGGDTSSHCVRALGLQALTAAAQIAPGVALLRGHSDSVTRDGLELALKGGQMGTPDFFVRVRDGTHHPGTERS